MDKSKLKEFGLTMAVVLSLLNLLFFWREGEILIPLILLSALFLLISLVYADILSPLYKIWMALSLAMGKVVTALILAILFYLILTPLGIVRKLFRGDPLSLKFDREKKSYWLLKKESAKSSYEKQF